MISPGRRAVGTNRALTRAVTRLSLALSVSLAFASGTLLSACGTTDDKPLPAPDDAKIDGNPLPSGCPEPAAGCDCPVPGKEIQCIIKRVSGSYVSCSTGTRTCLPGGKWSGCEGAATVWDGGVPNEVDPVDAPRDSGASDSTVTDTGPIDTGTPEDTGPEDTTPTDAGPGTDDLGVSG